MARIAAGGARLERLKALGAQLASAPKTSRRHRTLSAAIRIEADQYRKSLDVEQATATHDVYPLAAVGPKPVKGARRRG